MPGKSFFTASKVLCAPWCLYRSQGAEKTTQRTSGSSRGVTDVVPAVEVRTRGNGEDQMKTGAEVVLQIGSSLAARAGGGAGSPQY